MIKCWFQFKHCSFESIQILKMPDKGLWEGEEWERREWGTLYSMHYIILHIGKDRKGGGGLDPLLCLDVVQWQLYIVI